MTYTVTKLVTEAYYASGIVSRDFSTVDGGQLNFGVQILNDLLAEKLIDDKLIPYYKKYDLTYVIGQEQYFIPNLIQIDTMTFVIDSVRYPMRPENRRDYFGTARANDIDSLPFSWHIERTLNGTNVYVYFKPQTAWVAEIWGKFGLDATTGLLQDLLLVYDRYYLTFLKYQLADRLCVEYNFDTPAGVAKEYARLSKIISKKSAVLDLELKCVSTLTKKSALTYAQVNIGKAWSAGNS